MTMRKRREEERGPLWDVWCSRDGADASDETRLEDWDLTIEIVKKYENVQIQMFLSTRKNIKICF